MTKKRSLVPVYLAAVAYACVTGFSFVFTKFALEYSTPIPILAHRFLFSFIALVATLAFRGELSFFKGKTFRNVAPLALIYPLLFFGFQTFGLQHASSAEGGILLAVAPVFTLILSHFFLKEKATWLQAASVLLSVLGVVYIFYNTAKLEEGSGSTSVLGIVLLLITTLCFSVYSVLGRRYTAKYKNLELLTVMITIGVIGFHLLAFATNPSILYPREYFAPFKNPKYTLAILYLGVLSTLGTSLLTNFILSRLEASKMSVFANLGTLISIVAGAAVLGEPVYLFHILGAGCIILGVVGTNFGSGKTKGKETTKQA